MQYFLLVWSLTFSLWASCFFLEAGPVEDYYLESPAYNSLEWDKVFLETWNLNSLENWDQFVYEKYLQYESEWERQFDTQITNFLENYTGSDAYNPEENYLDYALSYLNSQKETSFTMWEQETISRIQEERNLFLTKLDESSSLNELWNEWANTFSDRLNVGLTEFQNALETLHSDYSAFMQEMNSVQENFYRNEARIEGYENLVRDSIANQIFEMKVNILTNSLLQKNYYFQNGENFSQDTVFQGEIYHFLKEEDRNGWGQEEYKAEFTKFQNATLFLKDKIEGDWELNFRKQKVSDLILNESGKKLFSLVESMEKSLEEKASFVELSQKLKDYLKEEATFIESNISYYTSMEYTDIDTGKQDSIYSLYMPTREYLDSIPKQVHSLNSSMQNISILIKEYIDNGRVDQTRLLQYMNSNLSGTHLKIHSISDIDLIGYTDDHRLYTNFNWINHERRGGKYISGFNHSNPSDGYDFYEYDYNGWGCGFGVCGRVTEMYWEEFVILQMRYQIQDTNASAMKNSWTNYLNQINGQIELWEKDIHPAISAWESQTSGYKKKLEDWENRKVTLSNIAIEEFQKKETELLANRDSWIQKTYNSFQENYHSGNVDSLEVETVHVEMGKNFSTASEKLEEFSKESKIEFQDSKKESELFSFFTNTLTGVNNLSYVSSMTETMQNSQATIIQSYANSLRDFRIAKEGLNEADAAIFHKEIFEKSYIHSTCGTGIGYKLSFDENSTNIKCDNGANKTIQASFVGLCIDQNTNKERCDNLLSSDRYGVNKFEKVEVKGDRIVLTQRIKDGTAYSGNILELNPNNFTLGTTLIQREIKMGVVGMDTTGLIDIFGEDWNRAPISTEEKKFSNPILLQFQSYFDESAKENYNEYLKVLAKKEEEKNDPNWEQPESLLGKLFNSFQTQFGNKNENNINGKEGASGIYGKQISDSISQAVSYMDSINITLI